MRRRIISWSKTILTGITIIAFYFLAARFGLSLAFSNPSASPVWPPSGIALAALILAGIRFWPAVFIGAFLANLMSLDPTTAIGIASGNTVEALVGALLVNRFAGGKGLFTQGQNIVRFALIAILAAMLAATAGVTTLLLAGQMPLSQYAHTWLTWWLGDSVGLLLFAPLVMLWLERPLLRWKDNKLPEFITTMVVLSMVLFFIYGPISLNLPIQFLLGPLFIWSAFRLGRRETATAVLLTAMFAIWGTVHGFGPYYQTGSINDSLLLLQVYMGFQVTVNLVIATLFHQKQVAEHELKITLGEKDALLKEIHHRVKNNLQVVTGMLRLQSKQAKSKELATVMAEAQNRIKTIALVHESLYHSNSLKDIDLRQYLDELVKSLATPGVKMSTKISPVRIKFEEGLLYGLIINELISNTLKHAFPDGEGTVLIGVTTRRKHLTLRFSDSGKGMPPGFSIDRSPSLGLKLVKAFVVQLKGTMTIRSGQGTRITIKAPLNHVARKS